MNNTATLQRIYFQTQLYGALSAILALQSRVEGMQLANAERTAQNASPAYGEEDFARVTADFTALERRMESLSTKIVQFGNDAETKRDGLDALHSIGLLLGDNESARALVVRVAEAIG